MSAVISPDGQYRYMLSRPGEHQAAFVMLNPSTADASVDDATIRKCRRFAADWHYSGIVVANCYALRSTDPAPLKTHADPVGPDNDAYLLSIATMPLIVVAWGRHAEQKRARIVSRLLRSAGAKLYCLRVNADGSPMHPLYVPFSQNLMPWSD